MKVRKVMIPVAGHGTRMFPASKTIPKVLFPILDPFDGLCKPLLLFIMEQVLLAFAEEERNDIQFYIIVSPNQKPMLENLFSNNDLNPVYGQKAELAKQIETISQLSKQVTWVIQEKQQGFGHAVLCGREFIGNEAFLLLLGDHVLLSMDCEKLNCIRQVLDAYERCGKDVISVCPCNENVLKLYGIVAAELPDNESKQIQDNDPTLFHSCMKVVNIAEKPNIETAQKHLQIRNQDHIKIINAYKKISAKMPLKNAGSECERMKYLKVTGIYCFTPNLFKNLEHNCNKNLTTHGEIQLTDAMHSLIGQNGLNAVLMNGAVYDTGIPSEYTHTMAALRELYKQLQI